ncbi:MAG TPA: hypothetical protein VJY40_07065, partial [Corynebacterium sp.]|nr:hypothetical protein [Corynebacterium sp.]
MVDDAVPVEVRVHRGAPAVGERDGVTGVAVEQVVLTTQVQVERPAAVQSLKSVEHLRLLRQLPSQPRRLRGWGPQDAGALP